MDKIKDVCVVLLCCKWDDTEVYCLQELAKITDDHLVVHHNFENDDTEFLDKIVEDSPKLKLVVLVNNNKNVSRYYHMYNLHLKLSATYKACIPFVNNSLEDSLCIAHDTMSRAMQRSCDQQITVIKEFFQNDDDIIKLNNKIYFN